MSLNHKVAIVTGASSGIGLETARGLARAGYRVVLACRNEEKATPLAAEIRAACGSDRAEVMVLELASTQSVCQFAEIFKSKTKRLDVLINNAGIFTDNLEHTANGFELSMGVNYLGHYLLTRLLLPIMLDAGRGRIVNVTSKAGLYGKLEPGDNIFRGKKPGFKAYAASKLAQILSTIELAEELRESGVTVNSAYPGRVATNIWQGGGLLTNFVATWLMRRSVSPAEGAKTSLYLALSPEVALVSGKLFFEQEIVEYSKVCSDEGLRRTLVKASDEVVKNACG